MQDSSWSARVDGQPEAHILTPTTYHDPYFDQPAVKLLPGQYYVTGQDKMLVTVLGSCVAVCLRDPHLNLGGMTHFMCPLDFGAPKLIDQGLVYGGYALEILVNQLIKRGAVRERLQAKAFGGGDVLAAPDSQMIGQRNVDFMRSYLAAEQIPLISESLLGPYPQKIYFFPATGRVLVKKLKRLNNNTIFEREAAYCEQLLQVHISGNIELFSE
ncbi:chemoreceptor glutamine deamidase CheD [Marinospirillum sp. MEB164]|uniref:Probable chemoreceptor glutamine deamidase CheD n=1 Tax=Marinospirillum alkalitolerans TaxID=3123374 RepID=A0ABW8PZJ5_9GAMM